MSRLCGLCDEKHQATHYCVECQEFMCAMLAGVHTKLRATKSHIIQDANQVADIQSKISTALKDLDEARSDIFLQLADASPPRNATSLAAEQRAYNLFAAFINMGVLLNHQRDTLVDMQQALPRMDHDTLLSISASPLFKPDTKALQRYIASLPPFVDAFGSLGSQDGCFNNAVDVAVSAAGEVFVCDAINTRVQVFTLEGQFLRQWSLPPQPSHPSALCVAPCGDVYVIQSGSAFVSRFQPSGNLVHMFNCRPGPSSIITDVATSGADVFVLSHTEVRVFTREGTFQRHWRAPADAQSLCVGHNQTVFIVTPAVCHLFDIFGNQMAAWGGFSAAKKVTVDRSEIYVAETTGVRVFDTGGLYLRALGHSKAPQAVAVHAKHAFICESHSVEIVSL